MTCFSEAATRQRDCSWIEETLSRMDSEDRRTLWEMCPEELGSEACLRTLFDIPFSCEEDGSWGSSLEPVAPIRPPFAEVPVDPSFKLWSGDEDTYSLGSCYKQGHSERYCQQQGDMIRRMLW